MNIQTLIDITGLSLKAFGEKYSIPTRTIENWHTGKNLPPEYVVALLERAIKEDFAYIFIAIKKLYNHLDFDYESFANDMANDYLSINTCRNGRDVIWYMDDDDEACMYIDTLEYLTEAEIEEQLV